MEYKEAIYNLRQAGLINPNISVTFSLRNLNRVVFHSNSKGEKMKTFLVKSAIMKIINDKNEFAISEFEIRQRRIDVFRINNDGFTWYEIASNPTKEEKKLIDNTIPGDKIIIDLEKVPNNINDMEKYLKSVVI